jgi:LPXTG-motif cell wall-anchored protein
MEFVKDCNLTFAPQLRNYQVNPIVNIVEKNCHDILTRADISLMIAVGVIVLLLIALFVMYIKRKKQK